MVTYKEAGVDIEAGNCLVDRLKASCPSIGGFSGLYPFGNQYLAASTDGVGTKLRLAFHMRRHHTIGIDLVAMCANDLVAVGARPLFFLDYYGTGKLNVDQAEEVISGIIAGCEEALCVLLGGETAEMPGFYKEGEYDLAGFVVGVVDKDAVIDGSSICSGDIILALPSSGVHSNGYSLVRRILSDSDLLLTAPWGESTLGDELLKPTRIYVKTALNMCSQFAIKGIAHITGGGLEENAARIFPEGTHPEIDWSSWERPSIFRWLQEIGGVPEDDMRRTFNLGIGMVFVVDPCVAADLRLAYPELIQIGEVTGR